MLQKLWAVLFFTNYFDGESKLELLDKKDANTIGKKLHVKTYRKDWITHQRNVIESYLPQRQERKKKPNVMLQIKINNLPRKSERLCTI